MISFEVSSDLMTEKRMYSYLVDSLALIGGHFGALRIIFGFFFSMFMPWLGGLDIISNLFLIDPTKGTPQNSKELKKKTPAELLERAKTVIKSRKKLVYSCGDRTWLCVEAVFKHFSCKKTKFARIVGDGMGQIKSELSIYAYLKRARMTDTMLKHLTNFYQKQLMMY